MRLFYASLLSVLSGLLCRADYQNITWQNPSPTGADVYDVTVNTAQTQFVLVGEDGLIATAPDGVSWQFQPQITPEDLRACTFGGNNFVAVGDNGTLLYSQNGSTWLEASGQTANFRDVTYGNGIFLAIGERDGQAYAASSANAINWTEQTTGLSEPLNSATFAGTTFIVVGDAGSVATSTSLVQWSIVAAFTSQDLVSVCAGIGTYVALGNATEGSRIFRSQTGSIWTASAAPSGADGLFFSDIAYYSGQYTISASDGQILTSNDASTWTLREVREFYTGQFLASMGNLRGWNLVGQGGAIYRSINGLIDWTQFATGAQGNYHAIAQGGDGYTVTVGDDGRIAATFNNSVWTNRTSNTDKALRALTYGASWWIAVGDEGTIMAAADGADNWLARNSFFQLDWNAIIYKDSRYTIGGENGNLIASTSPSGMGWVSVASPTTGTITSLAVFDSFYLGGTINGTVIRSSNAISWSAQPGVISGSIEGFAQLEDKYYALATSIEGTNLIYVSSDGTGWVLVYSESDLELSALSSNNGWLTAISPTGNVVSTQDGITWSLNEGALTTGLDSMMPYSGGGFLATGQAAKVAQVLIGISASDYFGAVTNLGSGWWYVPWLGNFNYLGYPTIYVQTQGFWSCAGLGMDEGADSYWFYDFVMGWLWTNSTVYPWIYVNDRSTWAYYERSESGLRWIFFQNSGWQTIPVSQ